MVQSLTIISSISLNSLWFSFKVVRFWYIFHYALTDLLTLLMWVILYKILTPYTTLKREFSTCLLHVAFVALLSSFGQGTGIVEASPPWNCKLFFVIVLLRLYWNQSQLDKGVFLSNYLLLISLTIWMMATLFIFPSSFLSCDSKFLSMQIATIFSCLFVVVVSIDNGSYCDWISMRFSGISWVEMVCYHLEQIAVCLRTVDEMKVWV